MISFCFRLPQSKQYNYTLKMLYPNSSAADAHIRFTCKSHPNSFHTSLRIKTSDTPDTTSGTPIPLIHMNIVINSYINHSILKWRIKCRFTSSCDLSVECQWFAQTKIDYQSTYTPILYPLLCASYVHNCTIASVY